MKTLFKNSFHSLLLYTIAGLFLFTSCQCKRGCEGFDSVTEQLISPAIKSSVLSFPDTVQWVFKCVSDTNNVDTIFLEVQEIYPLEKGDCAVQDKGKCCSDYYYEKSSRNLVVSSNSGLNHFNNYYTDEDGLWVKGSWGTIPIENRIYSQDFLQKFNQTLTLTLRSKLLTDTNSGEQYRDASTPYIVYWSRQYGIVKYAYRTATDTLAYERVDLP